jgi:hypothetical protein
MQKYKDVDGNIIKLKLFPFSLRGRAKDWLLSLSRTSNQARAHARSI